MRVILLSQYFTPELTAASPRIHAFAAGLAARGHDVEVICEVPSHPRGVIEPGYGAKRFDRRKLDGFSVTYVWVPTSVEKTTRSRLANYGAYAAMASAAGASGSRPDVVYASSPPLPVGVAGMALAIRHRVPWVLDVRDLWPAAAVAVGELRGRLPVAAMRRLERRLYRSAAAITTPSEASARAIRELAPAGRRVEYLPSGTTEDWLALGSSDIPRGVLGVPPDRFAWTYAGNVGLAQDLTSAVRAAAQLGDEFELVIVGDGPNRREVEALAADIAPAGVRFLGLQPKARAGELMRASDALLVSLADAPGIAYAVPSKLYDCCAIGRPLVVASGGEAAALTAREGVGLAVEPGNPEALADAVRRLRDDRPLRDSVVATARNYAAENLRGRQVERLERVLESVAGSHRVSA